MTPCALPPFPADSDRAAGVLGTPPVLWGLGGDRAVFVEEGSPVLLDQGEPLVVIDPDSDGMAGTTLAITIVGGSAPGERLALRTGANLSMLGSDVVMDGAAVATVASDGVGRPLRIVLGPAANDYVASLILQNVTYATNAEGHGSQRLIEVAVVANEGTGEQDVEVATIDVQGINDPPVLSDLQGDRQTYVSGSAPVLLDGSAAATVSDPDGRFENAVLTVSAMAGATPGEMLSIAHQDTGPGQVGVSGTEVSHGGVHVATVTSDGNGRALTLIFNAAASAEAATAVLRSLTYANTSAASVGDRQIAVSFRDADGAEDTAHVTVSVARPNEAPLARPDGNSASEDIPISGSVLANDEDPEQAPLAVTGVWTKESVGAPGVAIAGRFGTLLLLGNGTYTYVADRADDLILDETETDVFTYRISDGTSSADAILSITVHGADELLRGDSGNNLLVGGRGRDQLFGFGGNDRLDGRGGADRMAGGAGHDVYIVDDARDLVFETGTGRDMVAARVSYALATDAAVEVLRTDDPAGRAPLKLTGSSGANTLEGNAGANTLCGKGGHDLLKGGLGRDRFLFDTAPSPGTNLDRVLDFSVRDDTLLIKASIFKGLRPGQLAPSLFLRDTGSARSPDKDDPVIYDATTGLVYFDRDGSGEADPVAFARLAKGLRLTASDVLVV